MSRLESLKHFAIELEYFSKAMFFGQTENHAAN